MKNKQIFTKKKAEANFGKKPEERTAEELMKYGIVNIDKLKGPTSHQTSDYVKKILNIRIFNIFFYTKLNFIFLSPRILMNKKLLK